MKKVLYYLVPLILMTYLIIITLIPRSEPLRFEVKNKITNFQNEENSGRNVPVNHVNQELNCKSCHVCEYPTKEDPCLLECPRESMVPVIQSAEKGPDVVFIDEMSEEYTGVVFSHKLHTHMSDMSTGCTGCHHYNTTGPILNCRKCHESARLRVNVSIPDLKAAYHRQCTPCHKQWSRDNGCNTQCHLKKNSENRNRIEQKIKEISNKSHPSRPEPIKMIWETTYEYGKIVTFFHDEHVRLFKIKCSDCHSGDNCIKCHEKKTARDFSKNIKTTKSLEEHHTPCSSCHNINRCQKCHKENEMTPFDHVRASGWNLKAYHNMLECSKCHGDKMPFKKLDNNCVSCHKNFTKGSFNHKVTGLILNEEHQELECNNCHTDGNFGKAPICSECHDDKSYPADLPGAKK